MLKLTVNDGEKDVKLRFEHSLLSLSKWEEKFKRPFLTSQRKTPDEMLSYFQEMLLPPEDDENLVYLLTPAQIEQLSNYLNENRTASKVPAEASSRSNQETTTSELIYYWLTALKIPFHPTETWHISRIMMLIQITGYKNQPPKKRKSSEVMDEWRAENERRKKLLGTSG